MVQKLECPSSTLYNNTQAYVIPLSCGQMQVSGIYFSSVRPNNLALKRFHIIKKEMAKTMSLPSIV
jgi:hypothetical protein